MAKVLITNAEYGHTLSIIRSMAKEKIEIVVCGWHKLAPSFYSRYTKKKYLYTSPFENEEKFISDIIDIVKKEKPDVLLPVGTDTTLVISKYKDRFNGLVKIPISDFSVMAIAHNKFKTMELAKETGVPIPKTFLLNASANLDTILKELGLPVIIKAKMGVGVFKKANSKEEAIAAIGEIKRKKTIEGVMEYSDPVIQEFIPGEIHDACVLFNNGKLRAALTQKRLKTLPASGGPGISNETTDEPKLIEYTDRMFSKIKYHGAGLAEFIIDNRDNVPKLLEINPKFWGTSATSINAGISFPLLAYKMAMEGDIKPVFEYKKGIVSKLPVPNAIKYLKDSKSIKGALHLLNCFGEKTYCNLSIKDPVPDIILILRMIIEGILPKSIIKRIRKK